MFLQHLSLFHFRNLETQRVQLRPRLNFLIGDNGQGKTNFIEAVHLLCRGASFRPTEANSFIRNPDLDWNDFAVKTENSLSTEDRLVTTPMDKRAQIRGLFSRGDLSYDASLIIEGKGRKQAAINSKRANAAQLTRTFPTIVFSPESLAAIKEGPEQRRILIDELLVIENPGQASLLQEFNKCLRQRNRLLRNMSEGLDDTREAQQTLHSLNQLYLMVATYLTQARILALRKIQAEFSEAMKLINETTTGDISVDYLISGENALEWDEQKIYNALSKRHQELAQREISTGTSLIGPHKHDIKFLFAGNDSRFFCSQGQQRALILSFKIAQIVYHGRVHQTYPVLLLDDVLSELDFKKRVNLMKFLERISAQVLITATDLTWSDQFAADANSIFSVTGGRIKSLAST